MVRVSIFLIAVALMAGMVGCGPTYPPSQNLEIRDWYDLDAVRENLRGHHILMNDLDYTTAGYEELASPTANEGKGWEPIGTLLKGGDRLTGTLDGQGYEIRDLFINRPDEYCVGLFGVVGQEGVVENIGAVNVTVTGRGNVGGLVGENDGTVSNSYSTGNVTGKLGVGGLVAYNHGGTVSNSYSTGNVTGYEYVGGLVGWNDGAVSNSYSSANVTGNRRVGGLVGENVGYYNYEGTVSNCYAIGSVTGKSAVGGLVGENAGYYNYEGTISNCYAIGSVTGEAYVGGLVGLNSGIQEDYPAIVSDSFWDTKTSGHATSDGGTGKTTAEMKDIATFSGAAWDICAVNHGSTNPAYTWNIINGVTYPFLSWQS